MFLKPATMFITTAFFYVSLTQHIDGDTDSDTMGNLALNRSKRENKKTTPDSAPTRPNPFVTRRLSPDEIKQAQNFARIMQPRRGDKVTEFFNKEPFTELAKTWYDRIEFQKSNRFNAIGNLLIFTAAESPAKANRKHDWSSSDETYISHCTAFYIAPTILASSAHCVVQSGVSLTSDHVMIFRQRFDGREPYTSTLARDYERVVVEWIYMNAYLDQATADASLDEKANAGSGEDASPAKKAEAETEEPVFAHGDGFDFVFLRTNAASYRNEFYDLVSPDDIFPQEELRKKGSTDKNMIQKVDDIASLAKNAKTKATPPPKHPHLLLAGYPNNYASYYEPVTMRCDLATATDKLVLDDSYVNAVLRKSGSALSNVIGNLAFCIGRKSSMATGGSGGPWLLDDQEITGSDKEKEAKRRWVVGMTSTAVVVEVDDSDGSVPEDVQAYKEISERSALHTSPWMRKSAIALAKLLKSAATTGKSFEEILLQGMKSTKQYKWIKWAFDKPNRLAKSMLKKL